MQNTIIACGGLGLGKVSTTNHIRCKAEVRALIGIPADLASYGLMPIGWPLEPFGPLTRRSVDKIAHAGRLGAAWPT